MSCLFLFLSAVFVLFVNLITDLTHTQTKTWLNQCLKVVTMVNHGFAAVSLAIKPIVL